jgi:hypothetical protein
MSIIDLATAKEHLRVSDTSDDADLQRKLDQAIKIISDYVSPAEAWTSQDVPATVVAAVLVQMGWLYSHRGDEDAAKTEHDLAPGVAALLRRLSDPALA